MKVKNKVKKLVKKKIRKIIFHLIKPFLPFVLVIVGIVFALCSVSDALFTTEEDSIMEEKLNSEDYEAQYAEWVAIAGNQELGNNDSSRVPTGMFIWPVPKYTHITSPFGMRVHPITRAIHITLRY